MITSRSHSLCSLSHVLQTETIKSHNSRPRITSYLNPAPNQMISDSVELCETEVSFLNIQLLVSNVWLLKNAQYSWLCSTVDEWGGFSVLDLNGFSSCGYGPEEDATGSEENVSRCTRRVPNACLPFSATRHSYGTAKHSSRNAIKCERHKLNGKVGVSTAYLFNILKISWIIHNRLISFGKTCILTKSSKIVS